MIKEAGFVSLGDNCEFGFVQRKAGVEDGGLLRWAVSPPTLLARAIRTGFAGIFAFDNLIPAARRMVRDTASGIAFHTEMYSTEGVFDAPDVERRSIWEREFPKINHLRDKLNQTIEAGEKIMVYKRNTGVTDDELNTLAAALRDRGGCRLLYVGLDASVAPGTVRHAGENLYLGTIDRLAPYNQADDCSYEVWDAILSTTIEMVGLPQNIALPDTRPDRGHAPMAVAERSIALS